MSNSCLLYTRVLELDLVIGRSSIASLDSRSRNDEFSIPRKRARYFQMKMMSIARAISSPLERDQFHASPQEFKFFNFFFLKILVFERHQTVLTPGHHGGRSHHALSAILFTILQILIEVFSTNSKSTFQLYI